METLLPAFAVAWAFLQPVAIELAALLSGGAAFLVVRRLRRTRGLPPLAREQLFSTVLSGTSLFLLLCLAISAWHEDAIRYMLSQERLILVMALLFAAHDEFMRMAAHCRRPGRRSA